MSSGRSSSACFVLKRPLAREVVGAFEKRMLAIGRGVQGGGRRRAIRSSRNSAIPAKSKGTASSAIHQLLWMAAIPKMSAAPAKYIISVSRVRFFGSSLMPSSSTVLRIGTRVVATITTAACAEARLCFPESQNKNFVQSVLFSRTRSTRIARSWHCRERVPRLARGPLQVRRRCVRPRRTARKPFGRIKSQCPVRYWSSAALASSRSMQSRSTSSPCFCSSACRSLYSASEDGRP